MRWMLRPPAGGRPRSLTSATTSAICCCYCTARNSAQNEGLHVIQEQLPSTGRGSPGLSKHAQVVLQCHRSSCMDIRAVYWETSCMADCMESTAVFGRASSGVRAHLQSARMAHARIRSAGVTQQGQLTCWSSLLRLAGPCCCRWQSTTCARRTPTARGWAMQRLPKGLLQETA